MVSYVINHKVKENVNMDTIGYFLRCHKCNKKIIVDVNLMGSNHVISINVVCSDCIDIDSAFAEKHPEVAQKIEDFKNEV